MPAKRASTLQDLGEKALILHIKRWLGAANPPSPRGIGDDCALIPATGADWLVTVDPVIRGRHFDDSLSPRLVAEKLLKRNLSDIAAMGGTPTHAVIALSTPPSLPTRWLQRFYLGLAACARAHRVHIVGGDCSQSDGFFAAYLTLIGRRGRRLLRRDGARSGDILFVTGSLGGSQRGWHARFVPRLPEGRWLAARKGVHAAIDLSDGLGKDLPALVRPGTQAVIASRALPISRDARLAARSDGRHPLDHVLNDGEDFELLFATSPAAANQIEAAWRRRFKTRLSRIGRLVRSLEEDAPPLLFDPPLPTPLRTSGYEHFR